MGAKKAARIKDGVDVNAGVESGSLRKESDTPVVSDSLTAEEASWLSESHSFPAIASSPLIVRPSQVGENEILPMDPNKPESNQPKGVMSHLTRPGNIMKVGAAAVMMLALGALTAGPGQ